MRISLYIDEDSQDQSLVRALQARAVDVVTAFQAEMQGRSDEEQLQWATTNRRVLFSYNVRDFYRLHTAFIALGRPHSGIVLARQQSYAIRGLTRRLLKLISALTAEEMNNRVEFLSKWE